MDKQLINYSGSLEIVLFRRNVHFFDLITFLFIFTSIVDFLPVSNSEEEWGGA